MHDIPVTEMKVDDNVDDKLSEPIQRAIGNDRIPISRLQLQTPACLRRPWKQAKPLYGPFFRNGLHNI
jgi:hypothetical protein